ncbi:hypothetical protein DMENIID0001_105640 [Sergentomyia squamirostris]
MEQHKKVKSELKNMEKEIPQLPYAAQDERIFKVSFSRIVDYYAKNFMDALNDELNLKTKKVIPFITKKVTDGAFMVLFDRGYVTVKELKEKFKQVVNQQETTIQVSSSTTSKRLANSPAGAINLSTPSTTSR